MAYGRIYIDNLRNKVTSIFKALTSENLLNEDNFIKEFKRIYPKDYNLLQYEWEFKIHEFKKNRKGNPKPHPIRPEKILSNIYRNYYFKLIKNPAIQARKEKSVNAIRRIVGMHGYRIKKNPLGKYDVIKKSTKEIVYPNITYGELKELFSQKVFKN